MLFAQRMLRRFEKYNWYLNWRYSKVVLKAWLLIRYDVRRELSRQKKFYKFLLENTSHPSRMIFDIGANEGFFSQIFKDFGFRVVAVEPAPRNIAILRARFGNHPGIDIVPAAVSESNGMASFYENRSDQALGTMSEKWNAIQQKKNAEEISSLQTVTVTIDRLIEKYGLPAFIKIDVEGYEETALHGLTTVVPLLSFEAILPEFLPEARRSIDRLTGISPVSRFNFAMGNQMKLRAFVNGSEVLAALDTVKEGTVDIYCRM